MDCGPACIRMVAGFYGSHHTLEELRKLSDFSRIGTNFHSLSECARQIGFKTTAVKIPFESNDPANPGLTQCPLPCIVHWLNRHFVVVVSVSGGQVQIADPAMGMVKMPVAAFKEHWLLQDTSGDTQTGNVLLLVPDQHRPAAKTTPEKNNVLRFLLPYIRPHRNSLLLVLLIMALIALLQFLVPVLNRYLVDKGIAGRDTAYIQYILAGMLAIFCGRITAEILQGWLFMLIGTRLNNSMLYDFLKKILHLPVQFFDHRTKGDLLQRMHEFNRMEQFATGQLIHATIALVLLSVFGVILFRYDLLVFAVFLLSSLLYMGWILLFIRKRTVLDYQLFNKFARQQNNLFEILEGVHDIKVNNLEQAKYNNWKAEQDELLEMQKRTFRIDQLQKNGASFISQGKDILITYLSAKAVIDGNITMGMMLSVQYIIGQLNYPLNQLVNFTQEFQNAINSMRRINEVFRKEAEEAGTSGLSATDVYQAPIRFESVSFRYDQRQTVLDTINLVIPPGKTTAIAGLSGSGKSTLLKLLLRFYGPSAGQILLDNQPLEEISLPAWRNNCAVVLQNGFIFSDSLRYNITLGAPAPPGWLEDIIEQSRVTDIISQLPQGMDTRIGEEGNPLSQGQKQRILIARALYKNCPLIIFDEATNSLDAINERMIMQNIREKQKNKTILLVAHRLSTIRDADKIVLLENGRIAEEGTHTGLMQKGGSYAKLVGQQTDTPTPINKNL